MKTSRIKVPVPALLTRDDAEFAMTELATIANSQRRIIADRDAAVLAINERCAPELSACEQQIKHLTDQLRAWAESNSDQFPKGRKSLDLANGLLGFRTGTPKLALLSRAWNWDKVLAALKLDKLFGAAFVRTKEEVDKEQILGNYSTAGDKSYAATDIARFGLKVTQDESFFIDPRLTEVETRQTTEAS